MPSNHLIFCCPLLLLPSIFPNIRVCSNTGCWVSKSHRLSWFRIKALKSKGSSSDILFHLCNWFPLWNKDTIFLGFTYSSLLKSHFLCWTFEWLSVYEVFIIRVADGWSCCRSRGSLFHLVRLWDLHVLSLLIGKNCVFPACEIQRGSVSEMLNWSLCLGCWKSSSIKSPGSRSKARKIKV